MDRLEKKAGLLAGDRSGAKTEAPHEPFAAEEPASAPALSRSVALLFAIACGLAVANVYYAQPLLDAMASELGIDRAAVGIVITATQICYALGLLMLVPLGDLANRRKLIVGQLLLSVLALIVVGTASTAAVLLAGMGAVGLLAVVTQALVAYASTLAAPAERGRVVGLVTSGVVIGILLARTVAGTLTDLAGWRSVYFVSAGLTVLMAGLLFRVLPREDHGKVPMTYPQLLRSVFALFVQEPVLRTRGMIALLIFASFSVLWTSLVLPLGSPPLSLSHTAIGSFGLAGVAGALAAARAGRLADRGLGQRTTGIALTLLLVSWLPISLTERSLWALIAGVLLLDLAVQAVHVTNQSMIYSVRPESRSRLAGAYMIFYSIGSAVGSIASTLVYAQAGWTGVCLLGAAISGLALLFWGLTRPSTPAS
ncbi:MFS transporter [Paenibacillus ehimensis]|uniref:MFS transporter n=1 Tax=Paenibacillus ehimensis TaxID=79264 RepID=A0ABT8VHQ8_9BACL|nr:MFS transporter [Paenibacillus ehimensis]MDO3680515.1 MFS transporter [Paenibacillus ehimensis]